jgi:hypothetical protein
MVFPHTECGGEFDMRMVEFPPKVMVCPGCGEVFKLTYVNDESGATNYVQCGPHRHRSS